MGEGHSPDEIALALSPTERTALVWLPADGDLRHRKAKRSPNSLALWQLCHWRVIDGTLAPLAEPVGEPGDHLADPFAVGGYFRATALGLQVREVITREGPSPFARYTLPPQPPRKSMRKP